jgi:putative oxidoreductase
MAKVMISGGQSILRFFTSQELRDFFEDWFGNQLGLPAPLVFAFMAKGTEFIGGILIAFGLFTRIAGSLVAIVMFVATFIANIDYSGEQNIIRPDGFVTITSFLLALLLVAQGAGKFSIDYIYSARKPVKADLKS